MILRFVALVVLAYIGGFLAFALTLPPPMAGAATDAVIVLTGGPGRIPRGLDILDRGLAEQMFVSGVDREVKPDEFAEEFDVGAREMECCVKLGYLAVDTRSNAGEAAQWMADNAFTSARVVTTDWHMARAFSEVAEAMPAGVRLVTDAVRSQPELATLFLEYNKLLASELTRGFPSIAS